jgi:RecB family exonuclease
MRTSLIVDQLDLLCEEYPEAPLVVFVPRTQIGRAIETALARRRDGWRNLRTLIPRHYAEEVARLDLFTLQRREAPVSGKLFRAARIAKDLPDSMRNETLPGWHLLADTVTRAIDTLREGNVSVSAIKERVGEDDASDTLGVIAACYEDYVQELDEDGLYDDASVYQWATERIRSGNVPQVSETIYAVASATDLSEHAYQFIRALGKGGQELVRLGVADRTEPPPETAAARFSEARVPDVHSAPHPTNGDATSNRDRPDAPDQFVRAVGARGEVRAVLRDLLEEETALGDAVIAYADSRPYVTLLADEAERMGIPLTMGTGHPAEHTRTGRALRDFYAWVREDYDPAILVRMLRSGLLRTDRWLRRLEKDGDPSDSRDDSSHEETPETSSAEDDGSLDDLPQNEADEWPSLKPHEAATLLAERSYEPGGKGLLSGLQAAIADVGPDDDEEDERELTSREETRLARLALLKAYVKDLMELVPGQEAPTENGSGEGETDASRGGATQGDVREMAEKSCRFLERFGPTDAPDKPEEDRTPDEAARGLLYQRLDQLASVDVSCVAPGRRLAALFQQWLSGQYVQAESPRPGHVHVLPLESAGYSDRGHLHVVGLDSTTFAAPAPDNGMLQETDRQALVASLEDPDDDTRRSSPADEVLWRAARALRRHQGRTCLYTRIYDIEAGEERDPSSLFLQAERGASPPEKERTAEKDAVVGLVPNTDAIPLSDAEGWLQAYKQTRNETGSGTGTVQDGSTPEADSADDTARGLLQEWHPWVLAGEAARQARQSAEYTVHDGLLPAGPYPELDLFENGGRPLSASRLETLAEAPYVYFLKYVLGVRPLDEPALDEEPWLNRLRKGTLLHDIYERFMRELGRAPNPDDAPLMEKVVDQVLEKETEAFAPPSQVVKAAARRELMQNAMLFLRSESLRAGDYDPEKFEWGFGFPPRRQKTQDEERAAPLSVGDKTLLLRGRIDRVDRRRDTGALAAWDYKTGSASSYDEEEPLQDGKTLQWALYAYALESLLDETVEESGYFFANVEEMGSRISADPNRYRTEVERIIEQLNALAESGSFPVTPHLKDVNAWKWGGYDRLVGDLQGRRKELKEKDYPDDRPTPPSF